MNGVTPLNLFKRYAEQLMIVYVDVFGLKCNTLVQLVKILVSRAVCSAIQFSCQQGPSTSPVTAFTDFCPQRFL